ncbi:MAG TPA: branched-chain amino acid ABC transporter ATP-binding protein/permease [Mycobacteriales bacterium]|nr:branched-chain amino acid ABC transporter ATP-binding protein/permease [Mycobacteriales bacterium]
MSRELFAPRARPPVVPAVFGALVLVAVLLGPLLLEAGKVSVLVTAVAIAITALGLDLLVGSTGLLSLAHAALLGVGTFSAIGLGGRGIPWPAAFLGAMLITAAVSTVIGLPSMRIRGLQVAITALAFQIFADAYLFQQSAVKDNTLTFAAPSFFDPAKHGFHRLYYFGIVLLALTVLVLRRIGATRAGRSFVAVRDVEQRAVAFGVRPGPTKLLAYALSGAIAGLGGALIAFKEGTVNDAGTFNLQASLLLVAIVVVGGSGSPVGICLAAFFVRALPGLIPAGYSVKYIGDVATFIPIVFAALLIISIVLNPEGTGGELRRGRRALERLISGPREAPSPRPRATDPVASAVHARDLATVPRRLPGRLPVPALLVAENVTVQYGGVRALAEVSLEVRRGEIVGLIGANGAGKSTFFNAVSGLAPVQGSIRYRGQELVGRDPSKRSRVGIARTFQDMGLIRADTVRENLLLAQGWIAGYPASAGIVGLGTTSRDEKEIRRRADLALELFGLDHLAGETLGGLPYGTMRICEIAAAVSSGPDLLLLDEATAGLTPEEAHALGDRFLALRDELGLTLVVIEHHVPLIARVCDYAYCLESGELIAEGAPDEVTAQPRVVESFLGKGSLREVGAR